MIALTRMRTIAALCALLCFLAASAMAGVPGRPIDRPDGSGDPSPTQVGDPDAGSELVAFVFGNRTYLIRMPLRPKTWLRSVPKLVQKNFGPPRVRR